MIQLLARPPADDVQERELGRGDDARALVEARARAMHPAGSGCRPRRLELVEDA